MTVQVTVDPSSLFVPLVSPTVPGNFILRVSFRPFMNCSTSGFIRAPMSMPPGPRGASPSMPAGGAPSIPAGGSSPMPGPSCGAPSGRPWPRPMPNFPSNFSVYEPSSFFTRSAPMSSPLACA